MNGLIALVGSGEYLEAMDAVDGRLLSEARGRSPRVICIPAAAGEEGDASVDRWAQMGVTHFRRLGAEAECARITDRASADDPRWAALIEAADLIYFSGGDPLYLYRTLAGSRAWAAVESAWAQGAALAGCSAGAMIFGAYVPDVRSADLEFHPAFNKIPDCQILPHFDWLESFRPGATAFVRSRLADGQYALGLDEHTALVGRVGAEWEVMGKSSVSFLTREAVVVHRASSRVTLPTRS
jgi:cyanophycinase